MLGEPWVRSGTVASSGQEVPEAAARSGGLPVRDHFRPNIDRRDGYTRADTTADSVRGNACPGRRIDNSASDFAPCHCCSGPDHASARSATIRRFTSSGRETGGIANHIAHDSPQATQSLPNQYPSATETAALVARGDAFRSTGDMVSARLFYERAAGGGDGGTALRLGATFDPGFLSGLVFAVLRATPLRPAPGIAALLASATPPPKNA
jgi:hypothetical protein